MTFRLVVTDEAARGLGIDEEPEGFDGALFERLVGLQEEPSETGLAAFGAMDTPPLLGITAGLTLTGTALITGSMYTPNFVSSVIKRYSKG